MRIKQSMLSAIAVSALLLGLATPAFAVDTITISGNGSDSGNTVSVENSNATTVSQNNTATVANTVTSNANTGNNTAGNNTGGNVSVGTGAASTTTNVSTSANVNRADTSGCTTCGTTGSMTITGNGSGSQNNVNLNSEGSNSTTVFQNNDAVVNNSVSSNANTGDNNTSGNTGGNVSTTTGSATTATTVTNATNANMAKVGKSNGSSSALNVTISGNGSGSDNAFELEQENSTTVSQNNSAYILNAISSNATTGNNAALGNTNGNVTVNTGHASTTTTVDNMANFNSASVDCCLTDLTAKISGNGTDSDNTISLERANDLLVWQGGELGGNFANFNNPVNSNADTGSNFANGNTGAVSGINDPSVTTGRSDSATTVSNEANANFFGSGTDFTFPAFINNFSNGLVFHFDLSGLLGMFV